MRNSMDSRMGPGINSCIEGKTKAGRRNGRILTVLAFTAVAVILMSALLTGGRNTDTSFER